ncbi:hypothetical protein HHK36_013705 [Tetracentron sinense]|uniref:TsaA-like domain-containing protein n=1 Tax=Tetracentron sinense TaxID=13715 RepID=A0A834Z6R3_TETSI|nr:hypothetical protein HHK36_013705 [Tetracentron sinense]
MVQTALKVYETNARVMEELVVELLDGLKIKEHRPFAQRQGQYEIKKSHFIENHTATATITSVVVLSLKRTTISLLCRNGTPRQPLLVPLSRACLVFDSSRVPLAALEGLGEYSHCWIIYVFHLNTNLEKIWKQSSKSKFKAKVRVPRLKGGRMGLFATRSPHRPCPIGLTVAKLLEHKVILDRVFFLFLGHDMILSSPVEAVQGRIILLSGVDLVDGTPVLDVKPYLPYCDSIQGATVPEWVTVDLVLYVYMAVVSEYFIDEQGIVWELNERSISICFMSLNHRKSKLGEAVAQVTSWLINRLNKTWKPVQVLHMSGISIIEVILCNPLREGPGILD